MSRWAAFVAFVAIAVACGESLPTGNEGPLPPLRDSGAGDDGDVPVDDAGFDAMPSVECKDTATQSEHCGACNRHCRGGQCVGGVCTPAVVAQGLFTPLGIAVDATHVYWTSSTDNGSIERIAKAGLGAGQPEKFETNAGIQPKGIAVNSTTVYWTTFEELHRKNKDLSMRFDHAPPLPTQRIWWISASDSAVYFSSELGGALGVFKTSTLLVGASKLSEVATVPFDIANDVVWTAGPATSPIYVSDGGASAQTATTFSKVKWIAVGPNDVWWTHDEGLGHVTRASLPGSSPPSFDAGSPKPGGMIFDATRGAPYYVTSTHLMKLTNSVVPVPVAPVGCSDTPGQLTQDADALYWTCPADGKVWRWTKPPI